MRYIFFRADSEILDTRLLCYGCAAPNYREIRATIWVRHNDVLDPRGAPLENLLCDACAAELGIPKPLFYSRFNNMETMQVTQR